MQGLRTFKAAMAGTVIVGLFVTNRPVEMRAAGTAHVWTAGDTVKILETAPPQALRAARLYGARNEYVSFQIMVTASGGDISSVTPHPAALKSATRTIPVSAYHLYRETYQHVTQPSDQAGHTGYWPDGLVPIGRDPIVGEVRNGAPFSVSQEDTQGVWVDIHVPPHQAPGTYTGRVAVTASGLTAIDVPVKLTVWNFEIPSQSSLATAFGFDTWGAYQGHYGSTWVTSKIEKLTNRYSEAALQMRISMYGIDVASPNYGFDSKTGHLSPIDWSLWNSTESRANGGKLDGTHRHFNAVALPLPSNDLSVMQPKYYAEDVAFWRAVAKYYAKRGWLDRSYLYYDDEPSSSNDFALAKLHAKLLHQADPRLRYILTTHYRKDLVGSVNVWVPIINEYAQPGYPPPSVYQVRQKAGDKVWWYDSDSSADRGQWPDMFIDHPAMNQRVMAWMTWKYGLDGFLYYDTVYAYGVNRDPWKDAYSFGTNGDGTLFYPGKTSIIGGKTDIPCFSLRLMEIRQSLQDYEYMRLLKKHGQGSLVKKAVNAVVKSSDDFAHGPGVLLKERMIMGNELSKLGR
jgi:Domain of unknown function (DUF4091)/Family of unknown function (DUF6067)